MVGNCHLHGNIKLRQKTKKNVKCICHHESQLVVIIVRVFILLLFFPRCLQAFGTHNLSPYKRTGHLRCLCICVCRMQPLYSQTPLHMIESNPNANDKSPVNRHKNAQPLETNASCRVNICYFSISAKMPCYLYEQYAWNVDEANEPHT